MRAFLVELVRARASWILRVRADFPRRLIDPLRLWHTQLHNFIFLLPPPYVFIGVCLFVCLLAGLRKNYSADLHRPRWNWKGCHGRRKKPLDFGGRPNPFVSRYYMARLGFGTGGDIPRNTRGMFHSNSFAGSAALAEVFALLCVIITTDL